MRDIFVIDDTGAPGNASQSRMLRSDRCTYVGVLIKKEIREEISEKIRDLLQNYAHLGIKEFHFTDLINRRREYKKLDTKMVKQLFDDFADVLQVHQLPLFIQTMTPDTFRENGMTDDRSLTLAEKALHFVVLRIYIHVTTIDEIRNFELVCDEGIKKQGQTKEYERLLKLTDKPYVKFMTSQSDPLLQVADFYAFCFNRHQMLAIKEKRTEFDTWFIQMTYRVFQASRSSGYGTRIMSEDDGAQEYDQAVLKRYKETGSYRFWKKFNDDC